MKAVRMYAPRDLRVEEVDIPSYASDECLIKVMAVGVCGSDIPRVNQYGAHVSPILSLIHIYGDYHLFAAQIIGIILTIVVAVVGTLICVAIVRIFTPLRVSVREEQVGLDISEHGESAYPVSYTHLDVYKRQGSPS